MWFTVDRFGLERRNNNIRWTDVRHESTRCNNRPVLYKIWTRKGCSWHICWIMMMTSSRPVHLPLSKHKLLLIIYYLLLPVRQFLMSRVTTTIWLILFLDFFLWLSKQTPQLLYIKMMFQACSFIYQINKLYEAHCLEMSLEGQTLISPTNSMLQLASKKCCHVKILIVTCVFFFIF
jgi:hypothetical protein